MQPHSAVYECLLLHEAHPQPELHTAMPQTKTRRLPNYLQGYETQFAEDPRSAARQWFRDAKYGLFLHYGLYSMLGRHEWLQFKECIRPGDYAELAHLFKAERFDADAIADFAVDCGMKYINITTRHHDSFCLWESKQTTFNSVDAAPARRDLIGELAAACDRRSLGLCLYYSHGRDWKHPHAPNNDQFGGAARPQYDPPELTYASGKGHDLRYYLDFMTEQITELLTNYGPIASIWLDGVAVPLHPLDANGNERKDYEPTREGDPFQCQQLYDHIHSLQPQCLVAYKQGYLGTEDFFAPEHKAYNRFGEPFTEKLGEVCTTMMPGGWGHTAARDGEHKSADDVWQTLEAARQNQCNLLLNTGPLSDGALHGEDEPVLREVGQRLKREGFPGER